MGQQRLGIHHTPGQYGATAQPQILVLALRQHLRGTPCRTFMADMKVQADAASSYFYPDIVVTCSAADAQSRQIKREPLLIVEVLSKHA